MTEPEDIDLARRLRDHYRATAAGEVPASLRARVRAGFAPGRSSRSWWIGPGAAAAVVLTVVLGTALIVGGRPSRSVPPAAAAAPADPDGASVAVSRPPASVPPAPSSGVVAGEVAVLRGKAIRDAALAATDDAPFLIGGRTALVLADCAVPTNFPETPLLRVCGDGLVIRDGLIGDERPFAGIALVTDFLPSGPGLGFNEPAVVVRVHTHDARAADCPPAYRARCEQAVVVEQVVWRPAAGGSTTIPEVMSILPPQVDPGQCAALEFTFVRCSAIIERARLVGLIAWPAVVTVKLEQNQMRRGGVEVAAVTFGLADGTADTVAVLCPTRTLTGGIICGQATVEPVSPKP